MTPPSRYVDQDGCRVWPLTGRRERSTWKGRVGSRRDKIRCSARLTMNSGMISSDREIAVEAS
ncbi:MAG TPA: hypothetical protein VFF67_10375 [Thermoplasmata archaeon]|nr:hypothetical protein [Thermoplasmata archaeon]